MLHLKFKPKILPQVVAFMHIKTHQTGEGPHFVTFLNGFHYKMGKPQRIWSGSNQGLVRVPSDSCLGPVRVLSGSNQGPVKVRSGSGQGPVRV